MCKIIKDKYYKAIYNKNIIIKATTNSYYGEPFSAILIEDTHGEYKSVTTVNLYEESCAWNPVLFKLLKDYPTTKHKTNNELFPIY